MIVIRRCKQNLVPIGILRPLILDGPVFSDSVGNTGYYSGNIRTLTFHNDSESGPCIGVSWTLLVRGYRNPGMSIPNDGRNIYFYYLHSVYFSGRQYTLRWLLQ